MSRPPLAPLPADSENSGWLPWLGLLGLTIALAAFSYLRTEGTIFADAVEYLERAFAFAQGEAVVDAQKLRSAGITLIHLPVLWLSQVLGIDETRWILPYAALVHVAITCLFVAATVHLARGLVGFLGHSASRARAAGWFAGILVLGSPTLLQFSAVPMADIAAAAALAFALQRAFFCPTHVRNGVVAGAGFGLAVLAAYKTIPIVGVSVAMAFVIYAWAPIGAEGAAKGPQEQKPRPSGLLGMLRRAATSTGALLVGLGGVLLVQCSFDLATYGSFGVGLKTYVLSNAMPQIGTVLLKAGFQDMAVKAYQIGADASAAVTVVVDQVSSDTADLNQNHPATWYLDHFSHFIPRWLLPAFAIGLVAALGRALLGEAPRASAKFARALTAAAPCIAAAALAFVTAQKGTKEMRIWLPMLPAFAAYSALGFLAVAGEASSFGARLRAAAVAGALVVVPIQGVSTLTTYTSTAMGALARATQWLNDYEPLQAMSSRGERPVVASSYHWSALFRTAPHLELLKLANQPDGSFAHLETPEERAVTLDQIRGLDGFIAHSSLLRIDAFGGAPEKAWAREIVDVVSRDFHVAAAFWDRAADERHFGPILVFVRQPEPNRNRRALTTWDTSGARDDRTPLTRMERPLAGIFEQVELEGARAWWLPGDDLLWLEFEFDQVGPKVIADYLVLARVTGPESDQGTMTIRRPGWNKQRWSDLLQGTRLREGLLLAPYQGGLAASDPAEPIPEGQPVRVWLDLATLDRNEAGRFFPTGRLEPLDPSWRGRGAGEIHAERDDLDPATGATDDGHRYTSDFGHLLIGVVPAPSQEDDFAARGNVLRVEAGLQPR